jgi:hypothetical protein
MIHANQSTDNIGKTTFSDRGIKNAIKKNNDPERGAIMIILKNSFRKAIRWIEHQFSQKLLTRLLRPTRF